MSSVPELVAAIGELGQFEQSDIGLLYGTFCPEELSRFAAYSDQFLYVLVGADNASPQSPPEAESDSQLSEYNALLDLVVVSINNGDLGELGPAATELCIRTQLTPTTELVETLAEAIPIDGVAIGIVLETFCPEEIDRLRQYPSSTEYIMLGADNVTP